LARQVQWRRAVRTQVRIRDVVRCGVSAATLVSAIFLASPARAEGWLIDGEFGLATGLEGGDRGTGSIEWARARTRIVAGADLRSDEEESEGMGFRAFVEIEKRGSVGGEARYVRWITRSIGAYGGLVGTVTPETLFGGGVGGRFLIPFAPRAGIFIEPSFNVLPLGSDLPGDSPLIWALLSAGVHVGL
jgi:hypothetical protein